MLANRAQKLWNAGQAARNAQASKDWATLSAKLVTLDRLAKAPGPLSLRRCAESTRDAVGGFGSRYAPPTAARDVPAGHRWTFGHHPLAAIPHHLSGGQDDPPPSAA